MLEIVRLDFISSIEIVKLADLIKTSQYDSPSKVFRSFLIILIAIGFEIVRLYNWIRFLLYLYKTICWNLQCIHEFEVVIWFLLIPFRFLVFVKTSAEAETETVVVWDMEGCPIPDGLNPGMVSQNIKAALVNAGYHGAVSINAVADDTSSLVTATADEFESAGVNLTLVPEGE